MEQEYPINVAADLGKKGGFNHFNFRGLLQSIYCVLFLFVFIIHADV